MTAPTMQYDAFLENSPRYLSNLAPGSAIHLYCRNPGDVIVRIRMVTNHLVILL